MGKLLYTVCMNEQQHTKAGGIITRTLGGRTEFFLIHRHRYNDWSFPKGHIDAGESLKEGALREVLEETGLRCEIVKRLPEHTYTAPNGDRNHVVFFLMHAVEETGLPLDMSEVDGGEWCDAQTVLERLSYPSSKEYFETLLEDARLLTA